MIAALAIAAAATTAVAQESGTAPGGPAAAGRDGSVSSALDIALRNQPSAATTNSAKQTSTLDDYTQERWRIKLQTIVPYILVATPIILLIVLVAIRMSGVRSPEHIMLAAALVLVIQATLTVSLTAEGSDSLSASMGILGAIAGYLFGRARQDATAPPPARTEAPAAAAADAKVADVRHP
jgi:hypothetical protein